MRKDRTTNNRKELILNGNKSKIQKNQKVPSKYKLPKLVRSRNQNKLIIIEDIKRVIKDLISENRLATNGLGVM